MEKQELIPTQQIGQQTDAEEEKILINADEAKAAYQIAVQRLLEVNKWHKISKMKASCFAVFDSNSFPLETPVKEGDFIRIDIPGPGTSEGDGFDWVYIEKLEQYSNLETDVDFTFFVARPTKVPGITGGEVAHFFTEKATSTFLVFRRENILNVEVHGRNEVPNTKHQNLLDSARNLIVNGGSAMGMSFVQWHLLVAGILDAE